MQVNRIMSGYNVPKYSKPSFDGHYRSVEVRKTQNQEFYARVAGSERGSSKCRTKDEAVYRAIINSSDYDRNSKLEKLKSVEMPESANLGVGNVYFTDKNENIHLDQVSAHADYIVYAQGSGIIIL